MSAWKDITSAPKDRRIFCWAPDWAEGCDNKLDAAMFLVWKTNSRITRWHDEGKYLEYSESYFGVPDELDDYEFALPGGGPTLWFDIPAPE